MPRPCTLVLLLSASSLLNACGEAMPLPLEAAAKDAHATELAFPGRHGLVRSGILRYEGRNLPIQYEVIAERAVFEGDILLGAEPETERRAQSAVSFGTRWPGSVVPYKIDPALPNPARVTDALDHWRRYTGFQLVPRTTEPNYLYFTDPGTGGCSSYVGMSGGAQNIELAPGCATGSVIHEIGHAVGLLHEQSRPDRDQSVTVNLARVTRGKEHNFNIGSSRTDVNLFDFGSIMLYSSYAFSSDGAPTLLRKDGATYDVQRSGLSPGDLQGASVLTGATVPLVLAYRSGTRSAQVGRVSSSGDYSDVLGYSSFYSGWTHLAATTRYVLSYDSTSGAAEIGRFDGSGSYAGLNSYSIARGWTHIVPSTSGLTLFYNAATGTMNTAQIDGAGSLTVLKGDTFAAGWTHIVSVRKDLLLFYNANTGQVNIGRFAADGTIAFVKALSFARGWSLVTVASNGTLLFYMKNSGQAETGTLSDAGDYLSVKAYSFRTGWTHITAASNDTILVYNADSGVAGTGRVDGSGVFTDLKSYSSFAGGWSHLLGFR